MVKEYAHIRKLLQRFYNGETTPSEEQELADFFRDNDDIPEEFIPDQAVFQAMASGMAETAIPDGLADSIMDAIDRTEDDGRRRVGTSPDRAKRGRFRRSITLAFPTAAAIAFLILLTPVATRMGDTPVKESPAPIASVSIGTTLNEETAKTKITTAANTIATAAPAVAAVTPVNKTKEATKPGGKSMSPRASTGAEGNADLSPQETEALNRGLAVLAKAGQRLAYARQCIDNADKALESSISVIEKIKN